MRVDRGLLLPVLILIVLLLVLCMAELGRQPYQYRAAHRLVASAQARNLACSGLEDFRLKWQHDHSFPPPFPEGNDLFSYLETVNDPVTGQNIGSFRITVDGSWRRQPYNVYRVTSEGIIGSACYYSIQALLDFEPASRSGGGGLNPSFGQWIEWRENTID